MCGKWYMCGKTPRARKLRRRSPTFYRFVESVANGKHTTSINVSRDSIQNDSVAFHSEIPSSLPRGMLVNGKRCLRQRCGFGYPLDPSRGGRIWTSNVFVTPFYQWNKALSYQSYQSYQRTVGRSSDIDSLSQNAPCDRFSTIHRSGYLSIQ